MRKHLTYGTPIDECVKAFAAELPHDAVGLWQIANTLKRGYGLERPDLEKFTRESIAHLLQAGAVPVYGSNLDNLWHKAAGFDGSPEQIVEQVVQYAIDLGRDPDVQDLWFAFPQHVASAGA